MKKLILGSVMALSIFSASAQSKIGYISADELITVMPEAAKIDAELKQFQADLTQQGQDMMKDLNVKDSLFVRDSVNLSATMKEIKRNELMTQYQQVQGWNQRAQELYQQKAQEKIAPLRDKAMDAIRAVAKENGYAYVLDINSVIVAPPGDNLMELVKKKLGVKDTQAANKPTQKIPGKN